MTTRLPAPHPAAEAPEASEAPDTAKRRQIMEGARTVFRAKGFDGASMDGIAREAGVSKGTLYVYFESKEALFEALIREERGMQPETVVELSEAHSDISTDLNTLGRTYVERMVAADKMSTARMVIGAAEKFPQFGAMLYESGPCQGIARLSAYLQTRVDAGDLRPCDTEMAASHFFDLCMSRFLRRLLLNVKPAPTDAEIRDNVACGVEVFLAAYGPKSDA